MTNPEIWGGETELVERVKELEEQLAEVRNFLANLALGKTIDEIPIHLFPGGLAPEPKTDGAVGYDARARAIVHSDRMEADGVLRASRADFLKTPGWERRLDPAMAEWVRSDPQNRDDYYAIAVPRGERCMVGLGFATAMPLPLFYYVQPRSGYATKGINLDNAPGTVDPDYRGEAGALLTNRSDDEFLISHGMRIVQVVFHLAIMPKFRLVAEHNELPASLRGIGGFGSTGTHD